MIPTTIKEVKILLLFFSYMITLNITVCNGATFLENDTSRVIQLNNSANSLLTTNINQSEILSKKALQLSENLNFEKGKIKSLKLLAQIYEIKKQFTKSVLYYEQYTSKKDSIQKKGSERQVALLNAEHDYKVKEAQIEIEQTLKEKKLESLINQKQSEQSRLMIFFLFIAIALIIITCYLFLVKNRNNELRKQQYEIEQIALKQSEIIENKTSQLLSSNDAISHYAFLNSHELRAPLAKILSIVYLFDQMNITEVAFSKLLKKSAKELEAAVNKIIEELPKESTNDLP